MGSPKQVPLLGIRVEYTSPRHAGGEFIGFWMPLSHSQGRARRELVVGASLITLVHLGSWVWWYSHPVCDDIASGKCEVLKIYNTEGFFQKRGLCKDTEMQERRMNFRHWKAFLMVRAQLLVTRGSATGIEMKGRQRPNDKELRDFDFLPVYEGYWIALNRCVAPACDLGRSSQQHCGGPNGGVRMNKVIINNHHPAGLVSSTCLGGWVGTEWLKSRSAFGGPWDTAHPEILIAVANHFGQICGATVHLFSFLHIPRRLA